ncbi:MAG: hypothetical protein K2M27_07410 [Muribaculaceae bacterium]|nr:hypothetical protein [Muribaculaceae bacterium]
MKFGDVEGGKRGIVGKIESLFIACLTVRESGELMSVTKTELNLEPCLVDVIDILATDSGVG